MFKRFRQWLRQRREAAVLRRWQMCDTLVQHAMAERAVIRALVAEEFFGRVSDGHHELRLVEVKRLTRVNVGDLRAAGVPEYAIAAAATRVDERLLMKKYPQLAQTGLISEKTEMMVRVRAIGTLRGIDFNESDL